MIAEIKVPAVGESIKEATIADWNKKTGDFVKRDEVLLTLETDKASVEVVAENEGVLTTKAGKGDVVQVGSVIGQIDTSAKGSAHATPQSTASASAGASAKAAPAAAPKAATPPPLPKAAPAAHATGNGGEVLSPAVRKIVTENNLNPASIAGTGRDGRITKGDAMTAAAGASAAPVAKSGPPAKTEIPPLPVARTGTPGETQRVPMSMLRRTIAARLVEAQSTAAILTTFNEIDMTNVLALREKYKDKFKERYGVNLGFMGFFIKAAVEALKAFPQVNGSIDGNDILLHNFYNIGIAVSTEKGLLVPVVRDADRLSIAETELSIRHYATKGRDGKISVDDLSGGTFTITNGGVFGSLMSTPILNPPQSAILGLHKIEERPVAIAGKVEVRPMMYVALSYDHRIIDGRESVSFLVKIKEGIEDPARLMLEI